MKKFNSFKRSVSLLLVAVVFISSTGFVSVKHFCGMTGKEVAVQKTCCCDNPGDEQNIDNIKKASCCSVKTNYFINAIASFNPKTELSFFVLPIIKFNRESASLFSFPLNEIIFSFVGKSPPLVNGRILLLQKSLLLI